MNDLHKLDELWQARHELSALTALESELQAAVKFQSEYSALWRAARLAHFRAMQSEDEGKADEALQFFADAKAYARQAVQENRHDVEGHFWLGVTSLEWARRKGKIAAASTLRSAEVHLDRAMNQDETYHFAGPIRVGARIMHFKPLLLGGSLDRACDMYRRALQIAPHNSTTLLYYCEALLADQQKKLARQTLHQIIDAPNDEAWVWEQSRDRRIAAQHLTKMDATL